MKIRSTTSGQGFTLVELLVAMAIGTIVLASIYGAYLVQQRHYIAQSQVAEMQQNIRAGMNLITRDIRMAGYDPSGEANAKIERIEQDLLYVTIDTNGDGKVDDAGEHIVYDLYTSPTTGFATLGRATNDVSIAITDKGGGHYEATNPAHQAAAQVIEALQFDYYDKDNAVTVDQDKVTTIVVSMLARAEQEDPNFTNAATYPIGGPWPKNDNYRRRFHQMTVQCRNIGF